MFGSEILEVAIGLVFVFLLVSIVCSAIREGIEAKLKTRAAYLERGIRELLHDRKGTGLARDIYEHPIIYSMYSRDYVPGANTNRIPIFASGRQLPSYIPAGSFALALMDLAARGHTSDPDAPEITLANIRANIININNEPVQRAVLAAIDSAQGDLERAQQNLKNWFDNSMDRVSGWYKRSTQWIIFWVALAVSVFWNVNPVTIANHLYRNDTARLAIVERASVAAADTNFIKSSYAQASRELRELNLPLGWPREQTITERVQWILASAPGWFITALAATFGAPFWFDLLNKMMVIRSTVKPREKSPEEGSEDRQPKKKSEPVMATSPVTLPESTTPHIHVGTTSSLRPPPEDGCDVPITRITRDDELPETEGGVA